VSEVVASEGVSGGQHAVCRALDTDSCVSRYAARRRPHGANRCGISVFSLHRLQAKSICKNKCRHRRGHKLEGARAKAVPIDWSRNVAIRRTTGLTSPHGHFS